MEHVLGAELLVEAFRNITSVAPRGRSNYLHFIDEETETPMKEIIQLHITAF